jgi:hypothetical protein
MSKPNIQKLHNIINAAIEKAQNLPYARGATSERLADFTLHTKGYAEPSYTDPESGVICVGNFNNPSQWDNEAHKSVELSDLPARVAKVLEERYEVELEWCDEWMTCEHCSKLIRTQADSYDWQRYWADFDGERICGDCLKKDEYITEYYLKSLEGNSKACSTIYGIDPAKHGYKLFKEKLENGLHDGMAADPKVIARELRAQGAERFLFVLTDTSQFYITFAVYVHEDDWEKIQDPEIATDAAVSPAQRLQEGLRQLATLPVVPSEPGKGIHVTEIGVNEAGGASVKVRTITPQEFIEGKAFTK